MPPLLGVLGAEMAKTLRNGLSMIETNPLNHIWSDLVILLGLSLNRFQKKLLLSKEKKIVESWLRVLFFITYLKMELCKSLLLFAILNHQKSYRNDFTDFCATWQFAFNKQKYLRITFCQRPLFFNQLTIFLNFDRLSYDKTIENSDNEPATLVLYLELKNRNRERHEEYLVKIIFKLKYKEIF